jgi:enoyl-CoA hydratase/carnithine racemase
VLLNVEAGVATLTLNRPDRLNAWTQELERAYFGLLARCAADEDVRVIVVTGAGRGFCAGADMNDLQGLSDAAGAASQERASEGASSAGNGAAPQPPGRTQQTFPLTVPKPIIAAINGPCAGIGLVQALMCDIRFAAEDAKLTTAFARRGLVAEHGVSWMLPRLVGPARALDLLLSGRVVLGREAAAMGLVNGVMPRLTVLTETLAYARELAVNCSPASMAAMKAQVYAALDQELPAALAEADRLMLQSFEAPDFAEGVQSFVERREPRFAALSG